MVRPSRCRGPMGASHDGNIRHLTGGHLLIPSDHSTTLVRMWFGFGKRLLLTVHQAPEYALDEVLDPASDMFSLGCLIYAVHCKGNPPFKNHGNLASVRENAGKPLTGMDRLEQDLRGGFMLQFHVPDDIYRVLRYSTPQYSNHPATSRPSNPQ